MTKLHRWFLMTGLAAVFLLAAGGCAQDVGDIDRTQPNKIKKDLFKNDDEWYFQQTIVDTDIQNAGPAFKGLQGDLKRIRWEITEDVLYAYASTPQAEDLYEGERSEDDLRLSAVAAFPITSHFDVQRRYNPSTGEPTNVIVENRSDRVWYNREYMRVDWSKNLVDGFRTYGSQFGRLSAVSYNPPQQDDHVNPNRAIITDDYIDVTVQYSFFPNMASCRSFLGFQAVRYCNGGKVKMRNSFKKVDTEENQDYIPMRYRDTKKLSKNGKQNGTMLQTASVADQTLGQRFTAVCDNHTAEHMLQRTGSTTESCSPANFEYNGRYGYFRTQRTKYDARRPNTRSGRRYYANRWPIWQDYHVQQKHHDNGKFTDMEIGDVIPMSERQPKPITFHLNARYPKDMIKSAKMVEKGWDRAFKESVALAKFSGQGDNVGISDSELQSRISEVGNMLGKLYDGDKRMFKIERNSCHPQKLVEWKNQYGGTRSADRRNISTLFNSAVGESATGDALVKALWDIPTDERIQLCADLEHATAKRGDEDAQYTWEQLGDIRYSFFTWFREDVPWAGYGPSSADPKTGRIISAAANGAGSYYREYVPYYADIIKFINGELSAEEIEYGKHIRKALMKAEQQQQETQQSLSRPELLSDETQKEVAMETGRTPKEVEEMEFETISSFSDLPKILKYNDIEEIQREADMKAEADVLASKSDTRMEEFFQQPAVKNMLMGDSQFQRMVRSVAAERYGKLGQRKNSLTEKEIHQAYLDTANPQRLLRTQKRSDRFLAERNMFAASNLRRAFEGLITMDGVAEAFKGMPRKKLENYLMDNAFAGTMLHEVGHTVGLRHNFSSSRDPLNYHDSFWKIQEKILLDDMTPEEARSITGDQAEQLAGENGTEYLSIEETKQASIMDYSADIVGRFHGLGKYDQAAINFAYARHVEQWDSDVELPNLKDVNTFLQKYTTLPAIYAGESNAYGGDTGTEASEVPEVVKEGVDNIINGREWVPIKTAMAEKREGIKSNSKNWKDDTFLNEEETNPYIDRTVTYEYCSDEFRGRRLGCDVFDHGANNTEAVNYQFNKYRLMQPFWRYMGQDNVWTAQVIRDYQMNVLRTMQAAQNPFRYYAYYRWLDLDNLTEDLQRASLDAFNFYGEVMATPEPGRYCKYEEGSLATSPNWHYDLENTFIPANPFSWHSQGGECSDRIDIEQGVGYPYDYEFTDDYLYKVRRVGTYVDKTLATLSMFNINANFAQSSFVTDQRATYLSYWTIFKDDMLKFLRGAIIGDYSGFAGVYNPQKLQYQDPQMISVDSFERGERSPQRNMPRVLSRVSYTHQFNSLAYAMIRNNSFQDRAIDFSQYVKIAVTNDELQPFPESKEVVKFTHPTTGQIYQAPRIEGDGSIAVDLLEWAKEIKPQLEQAKTELENAERGTSAYNGAMRREQRLEDQLQEIISKLSMIRFMYNRLGGTAQR